MFKIYRWAVPLLIGGFWIFWITFLLNRGEYFDLIFLKNQSVFENVAQFGDAFGGISSFMATIAAIVVYYSYEAQSEENKLQYFEKLLFTAFWLSSDRQ